MRFFLFLSDVYSSLLSILSAYTHCLVCFPLQPMSLCQVHCQCWFLMLLPCSHLSASMVTLACWLEACCVTVAGHPGEGTWEGSCPWVHRPCWPGAGWPMAQLTWWGGEVAMEAMGLLLLKLSEAFSRENIASASGKLGGVAGVLAGVHIYMKVKRRENVITI